MGACSINLNNLNLKEGESREQVIFSTLSSVGGRGIVAKLDMPTKLINILANKLGSLETWYYNTIINLGIDIAKPGETPTEDLKVNMQEILKYVLLYYLINNIAEHSNDIKVTKSLYTTDPNDNSKHPYWDALKSLLQVNEAQDDAPITEDTASDNTLDSASDIYDDYVTEVLNALDLPAREFITRTYLGHAELDSLRKEAIRNSLASSILVDDIYINSDLWHMNLQIIKFKNQQYKYICDYLGINTGDMYTVNGFAVNYNYNTISTLNRFKMLALKHSGDISADENYLKALNAFVNLITFDLELKDYLNNDITSVRNPNRSFDKYSLPYALHEHTAIRNNWTTEEISNGLDNMAHISKVLFNHIPLLDKYGNPTTSNLLALETIKTMKDLFTKISKSSNVSKVLKNDLMVFRTSGRAKLILNEMFNGIYKQDVYNIISQLSLKLLLVIKSFIKAAFDPKSGYYAKELLRLKLQSINANKTTVLDALLSTITSMDEMRYLSTEISDNRESVDTNVFTRNNNSNDKEALNLMQTINAIPNHIESTSDSSILLEIHDGDPVMSMYVGDYKFIITVNPYNKIGILSTNKNALKIKIYNGNLDVTSEFINSDTKSDAEPIFNRNAISNDGTISAKYQPIMDFMLNSLHLRTSSNIDQMLETVLAQFNTGKYSGWSGMLLTTIKNEITKYAKAYYDKHSTDLAINEFYDIKRNTTLPKLLQNISILSSGTTIHGSRTGLAYSVVSARQDPWLVAWGQAKQILEGTNITSTISDSEGKKIATMRQHAYGLNPKERIRELIAAEEGTKSAATSASAVLLYANLARNSDADFFAPDPAKIDLDVTNEYGVTKKLKNMTSNELFHHALVDNFYAHWWDKGEVTFLPSDYSDKSVQIVYTVNNKVVLVFEDGTNVPLNKATPSQIQALYKQTVGGFFRRSYKNTLIDFVNSIDRTKYSTFPVSTRNDLAAYKINYDSTVEEIKSATKAISRWLEEIPTDTHITVGNSKLSTNEIYAQWLINPDAVYNKLGVSKGIIINELTGLPYTNNELYMLATKNGKGFTEDNLTDMALSFGISIYGNIGYHVNKGKVSLNSVGAFLGTVQFEGDNLEQRWKREELNFIKDLLKHHVRLRVSKTVGDNEFDENSGYEKTWAVDELLSNFFNPKLTRELEKEGNPLSEWLKKPLNFGANLFWSKSDWINGDYMVLGKAIDSSGNIRNIMFLTDLILRPDELLVLNPVLQHYLYCDNLLSNNMRITMMGPSTNDPLKFKSFDILFDTPPVEGKINENIVNQHLDEVNPSRMPLAESNLWNTSNKRANIITATMTPFELGTLQGSSRKINYAVAKDIGALTYFFNGEFGDDLKSMDGSTLVNPLQAELESRSISGQRFGWDKKTIAHGYDSRTGATFLLKHATFAISNARMRMSRNSQINMLSVFKRMNSMLFPTDISLTNTSFQDLYAEIAPGKYIKILEIRHSDGDPANVYKMVYLEVLKDGTKVGNPYIELKTINNTYDLYNALGGLESKELYDGNLIDSENSIKREVDVLNNSIVEVDGKFTLPFKDCMIHYLGNESGTKRAYGNMNSTKVFFNETTPIKYTTLYMTQNGVLLDSDHEVEDASITLPTLAMTALIQGGTNPELAHRVYNILGELALATCKLNKDVVESFIHSYNNDELLSKTLISELTDTIGYIIALNYSRQNDAELGDIVLQGMSKILRTGTPELKEKFKIPFSDATLYGSLLPTIVSKINSVSIKGKFYGNAMVMTPGYKYALYFEYGTVGADGGIYGSEKRMADDVFDEAYEAYNNNPLVKDYIDSYKSLYDTSNYSLFKRHYIEAYLHYLQNSYENLNPDGFDFGTFIPSDNVVITYEANGKKFRQAVLFDNDINKYYDLLEAFETLNLQGFFSKYDITVDAVANNFKIYKDITTPLDLAPMRYTFKYKDVNGIARTSNIFLVDGIRRNSDSKSRGLAFRKILNDLDKGIAIINGVLYNIYDIHKELAENIMPNMYAKLFGVYGMTLRLARKALSSRVLNANSINPRMFNGDWDAAFTTLSGKYTYINFTDPEGSAATKASRISYTKMSSEFSTLIKKENGIEWIYKIDKDKLLLFKVGIHNGNKDIYFVNQYKVEDNQGRNLRNYTYYYINKAIIRNITNDDSIISEIIQGIYGTDDYIGVEINSKEIDRNIKSVNSKQINSNNYRIFNDAFRGTELELFIKDQYNESDLASVRNNFYQNKQIALLSSFEKTLETMTDRIPTATKLSFMSMKTVGFSQEEGNRIYVSHFLAWLLGSK